MMEIIELTPARKSRVIELTPPASDAFQGPTISGGLGAAAASVTEPLATILTAGPAAIGGGLMGLTSLLRGQGVDEAVNQIQGVQDRSFFIESPESVAQEVAFNLKLPALDRNTAFGIRWRLRAGNQPILASGKETTSSFYGG